MRAPCLLLALMTATPAWAGPWVRDPGHFYMKGAFQRFFSSEFVNQDNQVVALEDSRFEGDLLSFYGEVGLPLQGLQFIAFVPYAASRNLYTEPELTFVNRWVGDTEFTLEYGRTFGGVPVSLALTTKVPWYDNSATDTFGALAESFPILGDGQVDLTAWLAVGGGWSFGAQGFWAFAEVGYRHRTEWFPFDSDPPDWDFVDGFVYHGQLGWSPSAGGRALGWWFVDVMGIQNLVLDEVTKQYTQLSTGLAPRLYARPADRQGGIEAVNLELGFAWLPLARSSGRGWSVNGGVSLIY